MSIIFNPVHKEYLNPNLWEMIFYGLGDDLDIRFLVRNTSLPFQTFSTETKSTGTKHISEINFINEFSVEFNETEDLQVITYLQEWMDQIYDRNKKVFKNGKHTKNAVFSIQKYNLLSDLRIQGVLSPNTAIRGGYGYIATFKFKDVLLTGIDDINWSYGESGNKTISANFTVDEITKIESAQPVDTTALEAGLAVGL